MNEMEKLENDHAGFFLTHAILFMFSLPGFWKLSIAISRLHSFHTFKSRNTFTLNIFTGKIIHVLGGESHEEETLAIPLLIILESLILIIKIRLLLPPFLLLLFKFDQLSNMKFILIQSHPNKWSLIIHSGNIDEWFSIIWWLIDIWLDYLYDWLIDIHSFSFLFNLTRINDLSSSIQSRLFLCPRFPSCCGTACSMYFGQGCNTDKRL